MRPFGRMTTDIRQRVGLIGEDLACQELARRGYAILARRYRSRFGEIDIVARQEQTIVFVEVKARTGRAYGGAAAAVTIAKQRKVGQMAAEFLARRALGDLPCRFDVVAIDFEGGATRVEVYANAFVLG